MVPHLRTRPLRTYLIGVFEEVGAPTRKVQIGPKLRVTHERFRLPLPQVDVEGLLGKSRSVHPVPIEIFPFLPTTRVGLDFVVDTWTVSIRTVVD